MIATTDVDLQGRASQLAAEGAYALGVGDTEKAAESYRKAGDVLMHGVAGARDTAEKHLLRFLAASQYYQGGHYARAYELSQKIDRGVLPSSTRLQVEDFARAAKARASSRYAEQTRFVCAQLWPSGNSNGVLDVLKEHPYLMQAGDAALVRAGICERQGDWHAAAMFYADALIAHPDEPSLMTFPAGIPLQLAADGRTAEAFDYIGHLVAYCPNAVTHTVASVLHFSAGAAAPVGERDRQFTAGLASFAEARKSLLDMPARCRNDRETRKILAAAYDGAARVLLAREDDAEAAQVAREGIALDSESPSLWTALGIATCPGEVSLAAFRRAASLPNCGYYPYVYIAEDATQRNEYRRAAESIAKAAALKSNGSLRARLYSWLAACKHYLGDPLSDIEALFDKALESSPGHSGALADRQVFFAMVARNERPGPPTLPIGTGRDQVQGEGADLAGIWIQPTVLKRNAEKMESILGKAA